MHQGARAARAVGAFALLAVAVAVPARAVPAAGCADPARVVDRADGWTELRPRAWSTGPAEIVAYVAAATDERVVVVSNGAAVQRSGDGGCTWTEVHRATPLVAGATATVREIVATPREGGVGPLLMSLRETYVDAAGVLVARPRVLVSLDGGLTWVEGGVGLPAVGEPLRLRMGGLVPGIAYLLVAGAPGRPPATYRTSDAGATWRLRNAPPNNVTKPDEHHPPLTDLVVDPGSPDRLYAWNDTTVLTSSNGGLHWSKVPTLVAPAVAFDVAPSPVRGSRVRLRVFHPDGTSEFSDDLAVSWQPHDEGEAVTSVASIPVVAGLYATASATRVRVNGVTLARPIDVTPTDGAVPTDLAFTISDRPYLYGRSGETLVRRRLTRPEERRALGRSTIGLLRAVAPRPPRPASFEPARQDVRLGIGQRRRVTTTLTLPPHPTPLDVYFLSDTTGSMQPVVDGLRQDLAGIVNGLADAGIAAWFGVGDFREYPPPWGSSPDNFAYRRLRPVGPVNEELRAALAGMDVGGGARDGSDSALEALFQAATGAGRLVIDGTDDTPVRLIQEALDADFRRDSVRVVVLASDTAWRDARPGYPGPSEAVTFAALRAHGVHVVGLAIGHDVDRGPRNGYVGGPGPDLRQVAAATGTVAPTEGVDCDADGFADLAAGAPLVCAINPVSGGTSVLGPAMSSLLAAVADPVPVTLRVVGPNGAARVVGETVRVVDRKRHTAFPVVVEAACADERAGTTRDVRLEAVARGRVVTAATVTVGCGVRAPSILPPPPVAVVGGAVPFAPLPPPPPAPVPQPNPNLNPNANPQPNPQPGLAPGEDREQAELATVEERTADREEYAFSRRPDPPPFHLPAAAAMVAAAVAAHRLRTRHAQHPRSSR